MELQTGFHWLQLSWRTANMLSKYLIMIDLTVTHASVSTAARWAKSLQLNSGGSAEVQCGCADKILSLIHLMTLLSYKETTWQDTICKKKDWDKEAFWFITTEFRWKREKEHYVSDGEIWG